MRLTDCFTEFIAYVAYFINSVAAKQPPFDQVKADIQRIISDGEAFVKKSAFSQEDYDLARFAVCAWADEAILSSSWNAKDQWQREQLQRIYYQISDAGEIFFERLNTLAPHQVEVREIYYLCLSMGFTGRYCHEGDEYLLEQLKTSNLKLLTGSSIGVPSLERGELFPQAYPTESGEVSPPQKGLHFPILTLICLGGPVILYVALLLVYSFVLDNIGKVL